MSQLTYNAAPHDAAVGRPGMLQRVEELLTPELCDALQLSYENADIPVVAIGTLGVPCWLRPGEDRAFWEFTCPWWTAHIKDDSRFFQARLLGELARVRDQMGEAFRPLDESAVN